MMNKMILADAADIVAYVIFQNITTTEVLDWVYTIVLIASVLFGIVMKVIAAFRDKHITDQEAQEIKDELKKTQEEIEDAINKDKKEDE